MTANKFNVATKDIDLTPYGLEGKMTVKGYSGLDQLAIASMVERYKHQKECLGMNDNEIMVAHSEDFAKFGISRCTLSYPGLAQGERLSDDVIGTFDASLLTEVMGAIAGLSQLPLTQDPGKGRSKEPKERSAKA